MVVIVLQTVIKGNWGRLKRLKTSSAGLRGKQFLLFLFLLLQQLILIRLLLLLLLVLPVHGANHHLTPPLLRLEYQESFDANFVASLNPDVVPCERFQIIVALSHQSLRRLMWHNRVQWVPFQVIPDRLEVGQTPPPEIDPHVLVLGHAYSQLVVSSVARALPSRILVDARLAIPRGSIPFGSGSSFRREVF